MKRLLDEHDTSNSAYRSIFSSIYSSIRSHRPRVTIDEDDDDDDGNDAEDDDRLMSDIASPTARFNSCVIHASER